MLNQQKGFSLLEILVAFSILAMSLGVVLRIFSGGLQSAILSDEYIHAVAIADSLMVRVGFEFPLAEATNTGQEAEKYDWSVKIQPFQIADIPEQLIPRQQLFEVTVQVAWSEWDNERYVLLHTLKMANRQ